MEQLGRGGAVSNATFLMAGELKKSLHARGRMFRALAFISHAEHKGQIGIKPPFLFGRGDKLIDNDLRAISKVPKLGFPDHKRLGIGTL